MACAARLALTRVGKACGVSLGLSPLSPLRLGCGIKAVDALLRGGLVRGRINEITGAPSSGRTSLAWRFLASATRAGELGAVIDCGNNFDASSAEAIGIELSRLLLASPGNLRCGLHCTEEVLAGGGFALVVLDVGSTSMRGIASSAWLRLAKRAEHSASALLLLSSTPLAGPSAFLSLSLRRIETRWNSPVAKKHPCLATLFCGLVVEVRVRRSRVGPAGESTVVYFTSEGMPLIACEVPGVGGGGKGEAGWEGPKAAQGG